MLPPTFYFKVPIRPYSATPFWTNKEYSNQLEQTKAILNQDNLGIQITLHASSFIKEQEWEKFKKSVSWFEAEKFFNPYSIDHGAGRNVIVGPSHYKGVGRNHAASRTDWLHSWGGMTITEGLSEIIFENILCHHDPAANVPIFGGFLYDENPHAFIIRCSDFIRCEQVVHNLKEEDKKSIIGHIQKSFKHLTQNEWHKNIVKRFISLMKKGIFHRSPTPQNITIDGRFLDQYSLAVYETPETFHIELFPQTSLDLPIEELLKLPISFIQTNIDFLYRQCIIIQEAFQRLDLPVMHREEMINAIEEEFPQWKNILSSEDFRSKHFRHLFQSNIASVRKTLQGNLYLTSGEPRREQIIREIHHLVQFFQKTTGQTTYNDLSRIHSTILNKHLSYNEC